MSEVTGRVKLRDPLARLGEALKRARTRPTQAGSNIDA